MIPKFVAGLVDQFLTAWVISKFLMPMLPVLVPSAVLFLEVGDWAPGFVQGPKVVPRLFQVALPSDDDSNTW